MRIRFKLFFAVCLLLFVMNIETAQCQITKIFSDKHLQHRVGVDAAPGKLFMTNIFFKGLNEHNKAIDNCLSLHLKYGFEFGEESYFGRMYPNTYQGIGVSYNTFYNSNEVGNPVAIYLYQGSQIAGFTKRLSLSYEWNFGVSFGWNPYDENTNPYNVVVGSRINAYMNLGFYLNWQISKNFILSPGIGLTHYSNGNTYHPNGGVNNANLRLNAVYCFDSSQENQRIYNYDYSKENFKHSIIYDVVAYGAIRSKALFSESYAVPGEFGIAGINFNPMYKVNKYFNAGISLDCQFDESANLKDHIAGRDENYEMKFYHPPFKERFGVGASIRGEFVMPIFSINFGIGHNFIYKGDDLSGFYQLVVLKTFITDRLFLHTGYQLHKFKEPNNLMFGLGYRL